MIRVKIVGAGGYGGIGAVEIFARHPDAAITSLVDIAECGKKISDLYPHIRGVCDLEIVHPDNDSTEADVVFFATPDGVGMQHAASYLKQGMKVVDYSGDFRFNTKEAYAEYARRIGRDETHMAAELLPESSYGLAEIHRERIARASVVGNPGCFAVSAILGAYPAVTENLIDTKTLIFDAKTGVSGAGKKVNALFHYPHRYEEMNAYKIAKHQHVMEVERELSLATGGEVSLTFTTQVIPLVRGIMTSVYAKLADGVSYQDVLEAYRQKYEHEPFVSVFDENASVGNRVVRGTNNVALWVNLDPRSNTLIVMSHIDNLVKGQAGSAVQNMNILFGLDERAGLDFFSAYP